MPEKETYEKVKFRADETSMAWENIAESLEKLCTQPAHLKFLAEFILSETTKTGTPLMLSYLDVQVEVMLTTEYDRWLEPTIIVLELKPIGGQVRLLEAVDVERFASADLGLNLEGYPRQFTIDATVSNGKGIQPKGKSVRDVI